MGFTSWMSNIIFFGILLAISAISTYSITVFYKLKHIPDKKPDVIPLEILLFINAILPLFIILISMIVGIKDQSWYSSWRFGRTIFSIILSMFMVFFILQNIFWQEINASYQQDKNYSIMENMMVWSMSGMIIFAIFGIVFMFYRWYTGRPSYIYHRELSKLAQKKKQVCDECGNITVQYDKLNNMGVDEFVKQYGVQKSAEQEAKEQKALAEKAEKAAADKQKAVRKAESEKQKKEAEEQQKATELAQNPKHTRSKGDIKHNPNVDNPVPPRQGLLPGQYQEPLGGQIFFRPSEIGHDGPPRK